MAHTKTEDIGPVLGEKFRDAAITSTEKLFEAAQPPGQRSQLAEMTGITKEMILKFATMVDLFRIHGIRQEYPELLVAAGSDTDPELAQRNAEDLTMKITQVNKAKTLPRALEY